MQIVGKRDILETTMNSVTTEQFKPLYAHQILLNKTAFKYFLGKKFN